MAKFLFTTIVAIFISSSAMAQVSLAEGGSKLVLGKGAKELNPKYSQFLKHWKDMDDAPSAMVRIDDEIITIVRTHSQADLKIFIKGMCEQLLKLDGLKGRKCMIVGVKKPKRRVPASSGIQISRELSNYFTTTYQKKQRAGKFGALAIRKDGGWGSAYGYSKEKQARRIALRKCKKGAKLKLKTGRINLLAAYTKIVSEKLNLNKCRIIHVHKP